MRSKAIASVFNPNALINRTVYSTPQLRGSDRMCCHRCRAWAATYPNEQYTPFDKASYERITEGHCMNLQVLAAYNKPKVRARSYYYCTLFDEKEKEDGM